MILDSHDTYRLALAVRLAAVTIPVPALVTRRFGLDG